MEIGRLEERFRMRLALGDGATLPPCPSAHVIGNTIGDGTAIEGLQFQGSNTERDDEHQ